MLPDGVQWEYLEAYRQHWLKVDGREVALVHARVSDGWLVHVNRHRGIEAKMVCGHAPTVANGRKMALRWALANLPRLRREISERPRRGLKPLT